MNTDGNALIAQDPPTSIRSGGEVLVVLAAIPVHFPVDGTDRTEWAILVRRDETADFATLYAVARRSAHGVVQRSQGTGTYDLTYEQAYADLLDRAGLTPRSTR